MSNRKDRKIIKEAKERWKRCSDYFLTARNRAMDDTKFANGDSRNGYQWADSIKQQREIDARPTLTINKTRQHNLMIVNDARKNKPSIKVVATGGDASKASSDIFEGVIRYIEYNSNAQVAYDTATIGQVDGGFGFWRVMTEYAADDTFDQEIFIRRIKDPFSVYLDPDIAEMDGSDAKFGFIFDEIPREDFKKKYPKYKDDVPTAPLDADGWVTKDMVRIAEYYRIVEERDMLYAVPQDDGDTTMILASKLGEQLVEQLTLADPEIQTREVVTRKLQWFKIVGEEILERRLDMLGSYIPIVRVIGTETYIEGQYDCYGHTRAMLDPQRMYNYNSSAGTEALNLQTKSPWVAPAAAIEGYENYWNTANKVNYSVLPYNHVDDDSGPIPPPDRPQQPTMPQGFMDAMTASAQDMMFVSGQYQSMFGEPSNERSGKAINERQRQGETSTYHFIDNLAVAIRFTGKILIDLIPKVYDTPRIIRILAEDGTETQVKVDPQAKQPVQEGKDLAEESAVAAIFNPGVGRYEVRADVGPGYATKRQEAFNAFSQILATDNTLTPIVGDLMFKNADFPGADDMAERLKRMVPPQALGEAPPPELAQAQEQVQSLQNLLQSTMEALTKKEMELTKARTKTAADEAKAVNDAQRTDIEAYDAETKRIAALKEMITAEALGPLVAQLVKDALRTQITETL